MRTSGRVERLQTPSLRCATARTGESNAAHEVEQEALLVMREADGSAIDARYRFRQIHELETEIARVRTGLVRLDRRLKYFRKGVPFCTLAVTIQASRAVAAHPDPVRYNSMRDFRPARYSLLASGQRNSTAHIGVAVSCPVWGGLVRAVAVTHFLVRRRPRLIRRSSRD